MGTPTNLIRYRAQTGIGWHVVAGVETLRGYGVASHGRYLRSLEVFKPNIELARYCYENIAQISHLRFPKQV